MLDLLFDFNAALAYGTDVVAYLVMAIAGTTFFALRRLLSVAIAPPFQEHRSQ